jgi:hypothetical protein
MAAKHESMKKQNQPSKNRSNQLIQLPAFPIAGNKIFEKIAAAVTASRGYLLKRQDLARLMGQLPTTTSYWFSGGSQPHLISLFCLLEQLSPEERIRAINKLCRELPSLDDPRLRHDQTTVSALKKLMEQEKGLTFINGGGTPDQRTYLLSALGHYFCRVDTTHRTPVGLDAHEPTWFVPIETVSYLRNNHRPEATLEVIRTIWPSILSSKAPVVLLNGIWSAACELHQDIVALASRKHVIVADEKVPSATESLPADEQPRHWIGVSAYRANSAWWSVTIVRK